MTFPAPQLQNILTELQNSKKSSFYRNFWKDKNFTLPPSLSQKTWETIPFLTRGDITKVTHPSERLYSAISEIECVRSTSGTSGREALYLWRDAFPPEIYSWYHRQGAKRILGVYPLSNYPNLAGPIPYAGFEIVFGDSHNLLYTAKVAKEARVDTIAVTPTLGLVFGEYLAKINYHTEIKLIALYAEYCTRAGYEHLQGLFPNAGFLFNYASSESNGFATASTEKCGKDTHKSSHILKDYYLEIIEGELILTSLRTPQPFPLVRYKTGDAASITTEPCVCGLQTPRVVFEGRIGGDFINAGGGRVTGEEIDRILTPFYTHIEKVFKVEVIEKKSDTNIISELHIEISKKEENKINNELLIFQISEAFKNLRLSPTMKLDQAIHAGLFETPVIKLVPFTGVHHKNPRLIVRKES